MHAGFHRACTQTSPSLKGGPHEEPSLSALSPLLKCPTSPPFPSDHKVDGLRIAGLLFRFPSAVLYYCPPSRQNLFSKQRYSVIPPLSRSVFRLFTWGFGPEAPPSPPSIEISLRRRNGELFPFMNGPLLFLVLFLLEELVRLEWFTLHGGLPSGRPFPPRLFPR